MYQLTAEYQPGAFSQIWFICDLWQCSSCLSGQIEIHMLLFLCFFYHLTSVCLSKSDKNKHREEQQQRQGWMEGRGCVRFFWHLWRSFCSKIIERNICNQAVFVEIVSHKCILIISSSSIIHMWLRFLLYCTCMAVAGYMSPTNMTNNQHKKTFD